ncbi:Gfo/Idh/MocA family oxidoreductase [Streptomyces sp. NBC_00249]|uniref:Gfo/Idh/MocA family protein n=1 Tax=Streptomyces sp. NBC_00249 TaxID=2975690 RepID=UPI002253DA35|nr:Gfo/Idh/MocA family oxidoreductase [Streptomyces sp. NBC_00249]MCX5199467.1 Gfo/Idh/MocA family oxidoreductase [Streptomyces sp. NBC_00249]
MSSPGPPGALRLGVLGCADVAFRRMLPAMVRGPLVSLVAVASRDAGKARSFAGRFGCDAVEGYERLLARPDIDAVYIPLPTRIHAQWSVRALRAGKHVLCEKPAATTLREASQVVAAAREGGLLVMESFMFLHHGQHARVRELLRDGVIGRLREVSADFGIPAPPASASSGTLSSLEETGVYPLRAARLFAGEQLEVVGATLSPASGAGADTSGTVLLRSPSGVTARLGFGWDRSYRCAYELWGSEGRLTLDRAFTTPDTHRPVLRVERPEGVRELTLLPEAQFENTVEAFALAVRRQADFGSHYDDVLRQATLVEAVRSSALAA